MNSPVKKIYLHPGGFYFSRENVKIHTLLGSCISITLWHPERRIGGMCHFTLPKKPHTRAGGDELDCRYADDVIQKFRKEVKRHGTAMQEYQAKIFGGGNMLRTASQNTENSIGTKNSAAAMMLLMQENMNILVAQVGEFGHRRVVFDTRTGEVWVRYIEAGTARQISGDGVI